MHLFLNDRSVYTLFIYYNSLLTGNEEVIKIEINFIEDLIFKPHENKLLNLAEFLNLEKKQLNVINYDLIEVTIPQYDIKEVMLEKIRAIFTRNALKERDVLDLYLLNKLYPLTKIKNIFIKRKIISAEGYINRVEIYLKKSIKLLEDNPQDFLKSDDNIEILLLTEINKKDYEEFKIKLLQFFSKTIKDIQ